MARIALIADIHGNFEALLATLRSIGETGADQIVCLGDVVGYGPDPGPCIELVEEACPIILVGNHDEAVVGVRDAMAGFNDVAMQAINYTRDAMTADHFDRIRLWARTGQAEGIAFTHGSFSPRRYEYILNPRTAAEAMRTMNARIGAVGHTHISAAWTAPVDSLSFEGDEAPFLMTPGKGAITLMQSHRFLLNPGAVGQPRDRDPRASWGLIDTDRNTFEVIREEYDVELTASKMHRAGLPDFLIQRLRVGA